MKALPSRDASQGTTFTVADFVEAGRERLNMTQMAILNMIEGWADKISETEFAELSGALDSIMRILSGSLAIF